MKDSSIIKDDFILYLESEKEKSTPFLNQDYVQLAKKMLPYIGHVDSYVRDDIVYECLAHVTGHLTSSEIQTLTKLYLSDEYLFYDMSNEDPYSVTKRTFTLLQLVVVIYYHRKKHVLNESLLKDLVLKLVLYMEKEEILTGYDASVGWMHTLAHSADVIKQLFLVEELSVTMQEELLDMLVYKIQVNHYAYIDDEDERVVSAIVSGLNEGVLDLDLVEGFVKKLASIEPQEDYKHYFTIHGNVKTVLQSLYFNLYQQEKFKDLCLLIGQKIEEIKKDKIKKHL